MYGKMGVLIEPCKVYQYPVPLWCCSTGAGFFLIMFSISVSFSFAQFGQKVLISVLFKFAAARRDQKLKIMI